MRSVILCRNPNRECPNHPLRLIRRIVEHESHSILPITCRRKFSIYCPITAREKCAQSAPAAA